MIPGIFLPFNRLCGVDCCTQDRKKANPADNPVSLYGYSLRTVINRLEEVCSAGRLAGVSVPGTLV